MTNPLLQYSNLPPFSDVKLEYFEPAIETLLEQNRALISSLLEKNEASWEGLVYPLEQADDDLNQAWSVISHYNGVLNSDELRDIYTRLIAKLTEYQTEVGQNHDLYQAYVDISSSEEFNEYSDAQRKVIENALRSFRLAGVALSADEKKRFSELKKELSELSNRFSENVLDSTQGWSKFFDSADALAGLPKTALSLLASLAKQNGYDSGYLVTLDFPSYMPVMTYCDDRKVREEVYSAFMTRASDQGPNAGKWDNSEIINQILAKRKELAKLLGFENYAERSLATKMASSVDEVIGFLEELADKSHSVAQKQLDELKQYAEQTHQHSDLQSWDVAYYSEKLRQHSFDISQEELRPYFPVPKVLSGMFDIVDKLYGVQVTENASVAAYHEDVKYYELREDGKLIAGFYLDLYARKDKRGGAWMADCRVKRVRKDGSLQYPVAFLTCNFTPPVEGKPSLLTHDEVTTLFHEFGHGLHHMLTRIDVADVSGINGVAWDVVELPSQFFENWCWDEKSIPLISEHYETGEALPAALLERMLNAKHFQSGMLMVRQLEFALFDFLLHRDFKAGETDVLSVINDVRSKVSVIVPPAFTRFSHAFSHIFAGGYAAGYYSYKWAEVLAADAFSLFEEEGIFDQEAGRSFRKEILEVGGSVEAMDMFVAFRGRKPSVEPLLKQSGI